MLHWFCIAEPTYFIVFRDPILSQKQNCHHLIKNPCKMCAFNQFGPILCVFTQLAPTRRFNLVHFVEFYLFYLIRVPYWPTYPVPVRIENALTLSFMLWLPIVWNRPPIALTVKLACEWVFTFHIRLHLSASLRFHMKSMCFQKSQ